MTKVNPFTPGYGLTPPYLAGREEQQAVFRQQLAAMAAGKPVNGMVMYGPRGTGKTVMLNWLERECGKGVRALRTTPSRALKSASDLADILFPSRWLPAEAGLGAGRWLHASIKFFRPQTVSMAAVESRLASMCKKKPVALLVDEAHVITKDNKDMYRDFLQMCQDVATAAPFLLVLAGTSGLRDQLRDVHATFIERATLLGIGCLGETAAAEAIAKPLEKRKIEVDGGALATIVKESQGYPFFLQQWGEALWNRAAPQGSKQVSQADAKSVMPAMQATKTDFYGNRYKELSRESSLLAAASAVAKAFGKSDAIEADQAIAAIQRTLTPAENKANQAQALYNTLIRHDFVWEPPKSDQLARGIPSFMDYTKARHQKAALD